MKFLVFAVAGVWASMVQGAQERPPIVTPQEMPLPGSAWPDAGNAGQVRELEALQALQFSSSASLQRRILGAAFAEENVPAAEQALSRLGIMGYRLSDGAQEQLAALLSASAMEEYRTHLEGRTGAAGSSELVASIPAEFPLTESLAIDTQSKRFFSASVITGALIISAYKGATWRDSGIAIGGRPMGLAIDRDRGRLWVSSGRLDKDEDGFVGLIGVDLETLEVTNRVSVDAVSLNDIMVGKDGSVFVSDSLGGGVYRLHQGEAEASRLDARGTLRSPQGIALHPNGRFVYVADHAYGIAILALDDGEIRQLTNHQSMLDGIDGLYMTEDLHLLAIQNGTNPQRIIKIPVTEFGTMAGRIVVKEQANEAWGEPTTGQLIDGTLYYIADPQWDRLGEGGTIEGDAPLRPNQIRSIRIR